MQGSLQGLIREILKRTNVSEVVWSKETAQLFWDVLLLQFICKELEVEDLLSEMLSDLQDRVRVTFTFFNLVTNLVIV